MAPPPENLRLLRSAAVANVAAAAQQPREAGRSNSPTTWLAEKRLLDPAPAGLEREPGEGRFRGQNARRAGCPKPPAPLLRPFPFQDSLGPNSAVSERLILSQGFPSRAH